MPGNFMGLIGEPITIKHAKNLAEWFRGSFKVCLIVSLVIYCSICIDVDIFQPSISTISVSEADISSGRFRYAETARFASLVDKKCYETDMERAAVSCLLSCSTLFVYDIFQLLFSAFVALECLCRLCVNTMPISRKWDEVR